MSEIVFACPGCGQTLQAPPELAGETTECPTCAQALVVPAAEAEEATPETDVVTPEPTPAAPSCPSCSAILTPPDAVLCVECGYHLKLGKKISTEFS